MFCPKCGNELPEDALFCSACGAGIEKKALDSKPAAEPAKVAEKKPGAGLNPKLIAVIAAIVVVVIAFVVAVGSCSSGSAGGDASGDSAPGAKSEESNDNMPLPDLSELFKLNSEEAKEYLAAYAHDEARGTYYSSEAMASKHIGMQGIDYDEETDAGGWALELDFSDDTGICTEAVLFLAPLCSGDYFEPCENLATVIQGYLSDCDISEMTLAKMDCSPRKGSYPDVYEGYVLFDGLVAEIYGNVSYNPLYVRPTSTYSGWEKTKAHIADGEYRDVHSGGITYVLPYYDVYPSSSNSASAATSTVGGASGEPGSVATHDMITGKAHCNGGNAPDSVNTIVITDDEILIKGKLVNDSTGNSGSKTWSFGIDENTQFGAIVGSQGFKEQPKDQMISQWESRNFPTLVLELDNGMVKRIYQSA